VKPRILKSGTPEYRKFLHSLLDRRSGDGHDIDTAVSKIIADVRRRGDRALIEYTRRFDRVALTSRTLRVSKRELRRALDQLPRDERRALELAARRIGSFHRKTLEKAFSYRDAIGVRLGQLVTPLRRVASTCPAGWRLSVFCVDERDSRAGRRRH